MKARGIELVGVSGINPDFVSLAESCGCRALKVDSAQGLAAAVDAAWKAERPTLIEVSEWDPWLS